VTLAELRSVVNIENSIIPNYGCEWMGQGVIWSLTCLKKICLVLRSERKTWKIYIKYQLCVWIFWCSNQVEIHWRIICSVQFERHRYMSMYQCHSFSHLSNCVTRGGWLTFILSISGLQQFSPNRERLQVDSVYQLKRLCWWRVLFCIPSVRNLPSVQAPETDVIGSKKKR